MNEKGHTVNGSYAGGDAMAIDALVDESDAGQSETRPDSKTLQVKDPHAELPATARDIVAAARRVLDERGYEAVTLAKVAAEAGVNKASVLYHFGNKSGLVSALVDLVVHEELVRMVDACPPTVSGQEQLRAAMQGKQRMIEATEETRAYYDIIPHAIRDPELRSSVVATYPKWAEWNLEWLGLRGSGPAGRDRIISGMGRLISAIVDGLGIQAQLEGEAFDLPAALGAFEFLLERSMPELLEMAAKASGDDAAPNDTAQP